MDEMSDDQSWCNAKLSLYVFGFAIVAATVVYATLSALRALLSESKAGRDLREHKEALRALAVSDGCTDEEAQSLVRHTDDHYSNGEYIDRGAIRKKLSLCHLKTLDDATERKVAKLLVTKGNLPESDGDTLEGLLVDGLEHRDLYRENEVFRKTDPAQSIFFVAHGSVISYDDSIGWDSSVAFYEGAVSITLQTCVS